MRKTIYFALVLLCFYCVSCGKVTENKGNDGVLNGFEAEISDGTVNIDPDEAVADDDKQNESVGEGFEKDVTVYPVKLIRIDGKLYYDTGENSRMTPRCGTLDGEIQSRCDEYEVPGKNGEANFKSSSDYSGSGWQNASDSTKEIPTEEGWRIFKQIEVESILVYKYKSCMRIVGDDFEEIVLSSEEPVFDNGGNAVYSEKKMDEIRLSIPVRYGTVYDWGIELSAKDITSTGMTLVVKQSGGNLVGELNTGSTYSLQTWNGKYWDYVEYASQIEGIAWDDVAYIIPKGTEREFPIKWEWLYGELPAGRYMISKEFMDFKGGAGHDDHTFHLEFEIAEKSEGSENEGDADVSFNDAEGLCGYPLYEG